MTMTQGVSRQDPCVWASESRPEWEAVLFKHMVSSLSALERVVNVPLCSLSELTPPLKQRCLVDVGSKI